MLLIFEHGVIWGETLLPAPSLPKKKSFPPIHNTPVYFFSFILLTWRLLLLSSICTADIFYQICELVANWILGMRAITSCVKNAREKVGHNRQHSGNRSRRRIGMSGQEFWGPIYITFMGFTDSFDNHRFSFYFEFWVNFPLSDSLCRIFCRSSRQVLLWTCEFNLY